MDKILPEGRNKLLGYVDIPLVSIIGLPHGVVPFRTSPHVMIL
jgi:hypothetical protein